MGLIAMDKRKKTIRYRRCVIDEKIDGEAGQKTLQDLLSDAFDNLTKPIIRKLGTGAVTYQALTWLKPRQQCICGEVVYYEPNKRVPLVDFVGEDTWQGAAVPKDEEGNKRNLQEHHILFAIRENHVAVIQSMGFDISAFQEFLWWLLQDKAKLLTGSSLDLINLPAKSALEKLKDHDVKAVTLGAKAYSVVQEPIPKGERAPEEKGKRLRTRIVENEVVNQILGVLGGAGIVKFPTAASFGNVVLDLKVSYRGDSAKSGAETVRNLAQVVGGIQDVHATIKLSGGSIIRHNELTIADEVEIQHNEDGIIVDDAWTQMAKWLIDSIRAKKVFT